MCYGLLRKYGNVYSHKKRSKAQEKKRFFEIKPNICSTLQHRSSSVRPLNNGTPLLAGSQPAVTPACATLTHLRLPHGGALAIWNGAILNSSVSDSTSCVLWHGFYSAVTRGLHAIYSTHPAPNPFAWPGLSVTCSHLQTARKDNFQR